MHTIGTMTQRLKLALVAAFAVVAGLAIAGWVRKPVPASASYTPNTATVASPPAVAATEANASEQNSASQPASGTQAFQTAPYDQYGQPVGGTTNVAQNETSYVASSTANPCEVPANPNALPEYATPRYVRTIHAEAVVQPYGEVDRGYSASFNGSYGGSGAYYGGSARRYHHHHRSTAKSVAIVAGSAGVGAAIGGIAGGGKGAGIGALAGGAGGFIYDRLTHNR